MTAVDSELVPAVVENLIEEWKEDFGYRKFDLASMNLKAKIDSDEELNQVMRALMPEFDPADYDSFKWEDTENSFIVRYRLRIGEYETGKGYSVKYQNNRYCDAWFPKEDGIIDYMNLPWEGTEAVAKAASWYPLEQVALAALLTK